MKRDLQQVKSGFLLGATSKEQFPESLFPEVAFVGRSNVGKSSLLNSLVSDKSLAKVSQEPGKTQQINFFPIESNWIFVDLPGFGYAKVSKDQREQWRKLNYSYILERKQLRLLCILSDSRHDPQPIDLELIEQAELHSVKFLIVLTKCDKIKPAMQEERLEQVKHIVSQCSHCVDVLLFSSTHKVGRKELWGIIKREASTFVE